MVASHNLAMASSLPESTLIVLSVRPDSKRAPILSDATTNAFLRMFKGHAGAVWSVAFSPDGKWVVSGSNDSTLKLWNAATGALVHTFGGHAGPVYSVGVSPDGKWLLSGSDDKTLRLWNAATGALVRTFGGHAGPVYSAAFSPDGTRLLSGSKDATLKLWDTATGALTRTLEGHSATVTSVAFSSDGTLSLGVWTKQLNSGMWPTARSSVALEKKPKKPGLWPFHLTESASLLGTAIP